MKNTFLLPVLYGVAISLFPGSAAAGVVVSFSSATLNFVAGQTMSINLLADISDPVIGYGVDVIFDSGKLTLGGFTQGALWFPVAGSEPDDVAGLAFPRPVSGLGVILGTLTFTAKVSGSAALSAAYNSTNLSEGFPLASSGYASSNLKDEATPSMPPVFTPEPSTMSSVAFAFIGCLLLVRVFPRRGARVNL